MRSKIHRPSAALVVASIALFVALSGTAVAAGVVPLAKRALLADNAGKLQGKTGAALVAQASQAPGPASTAGGLVVVKNQSGGSLAPNSGRPFVIGCDNGSKIMAAGFSSDGPVYNFDWYPIGDTSWSMFLWNPDDNAAHSVTLYATCLK